MIALSSHRPFALSEEYARNQTRAAETWQREFSNIYYYGSYEEGLNGDNVLFVRNENGWPTIKEMAEFAGWMECEYVAIINADIVVTAGLSAVEKKMREMSLPAAVSYRHTFNPEDYPNLDAAVHHKEDRGMDIFVAKPTIWKMVAKDVPGCLRLGNQRWDSWVCGYFCEHLGYGFRTFTDYRCIFHPKHDGRIITEHGNEIAACDSKYFTLAKRPSPL